jgi:DNA polymerase-1
MTPYRVVPFDEAIELTINCPIVYLDTETDGFYGEIILLQIYHPSMKEVLLVHKPNPLMVMCWVMDKKHAWFNAHYDLSTIQKQSNTKLIPSDYIDLFFLARLTFCDKEKFSLDNTLEYTLGYCPYTEQQLDKKALQKSDWSGELTDEQLLYAATDVYHMPALHEETKNAENTVSYKLDMLTLNYCLDFQHNGVPTDQTRIAARLAENLAKVKEIDLPVNANSPKQVKEWLKVDDTKAETLARLWLNSGITNTIHLGEQAKAVRDVRGLLKQNTFLRKYLTERIYGYFKPSARSGRLTSNDMNLQQIPKLLKAMFTAPDGRVFIRADFSQLELRGACAITEERKMEAILRAGEDLHDFTAEALFGHGFTKEQREIAKQCNFNLLFGGSHFMLGTILVMKADILLDDYKLSEHKRKWMNLFPSIVRWQRRKIANWRSGQLDQTPFGRKYLGKLMTDQMNIEVQGFGSEVAKLALHYQYDRISEGPGNAILMLFTHDEYVWEIDDTPEAYESASLALAESMQEGWTEGCKTLPIPDLPMPVEVTVGKNLGDMAKGLGIIHTLNKA